MEAVPYIKVPQHSVIRVTWDAALGENVLDVIRMRIDHAEQGVTVATANEQPISKAPTQQEVI